MEGSGESSGLFGRAAFYLSQFDALMLRWEKVRRTGSSSMRHLNDKRRRILGIRQVDNVEDQKQ